jgi:oxygen-dependent protoporphyrinogen oxidase
MKVCVVGGGLGGLTAARALVAAGHDVVVREAEAQTGGVIGSSRVDGFLREHAASSFLGGPGDGGLALCHELGVDVVKAAPAAKKRWIYLDGQLRALPSGPLSFLRSDLLTWRGKLEVLREPLRPARPPGEDESMHAFAARRFGAEAARAIFAPFVTGVYAADAHDISLEAGFPRLAALDDAGGIVRGMLGKMISARRAKPKPATTPRGMWAPRAGVGALTSALTAALGERVVRGSRVVKIDGDANGPRVYCSAPPFGGADGRGQAPSVEGERFGAVVLAAAAEVAVPLVSGELATRLGAFHRAPAVQVYLGFAESGETTAAQDGFGFLVAQGEELRTLGCVFESTVWPERAPAGHVLLRCILAGARDPAAAALADDELIAIARRDVARALGIAATPVHASVIKWQRGVAQYRLGHKDRVRDATAAARAQRVVLAGADYRGAGVNDLCADAAAVVGEIGTWRA